MNRFMDEPTCRRRRSPADEEPIACSGWTPGRLVNGTLAATPGSFTARSPFAALVGSTDRGRRPCFPLWLNPSQVAVIRTTLAKRTIIALVAVAAIAAVAGCGGPGDRSIEIGQKIGGTCTAERYEVVSRFDGHHSRIYSCYVNGKTMCVTEENGIASDQTAVVRILFANTLGQERPSCLG